MTARRAFALPLVLLLAVAGSLLVAALLTASSTAALSTRRQLERYRAHHQARGLQEVIGAWIKSVSAENIEDFLGPDGHALDLVTEDGLTISVHLAEAQGTALDAPPSDPAIPDDTARDIIARLARIVGPQRLPEFTRPIGPSAVSVHSAPPEVLQAVLDASLPPAQASRLLSDILTTRDRGPIEPRELTRLFANAGVIGDPRSTLAALLTAQPDYWQVRIDVTRDGSPVESILATTRIRRARGAGRSPAADAAFQPLGPFLSWQRIDQE